MGVVRWPVAVRVLHWLAAVLVVAGFVLGLQMVDLPFSPTKLKWFAWHKWLGVTVFGLALARLLTRLLVTAPAPLPMPAWQARAAHAAHGLLYALMLAIPLTGWLFSSAKGVPTVYLGLVPLPSLVDKDEALAAALKAAHFWLNMGLATVVIAHAGAALKHHVLDRDDTLRRMLPGRSATRTSDS